MGLVPGTPVSEIPVDVVFIGSCTNGRIEDLRTAARVLRAGRLRRECRRWSFRGARRCAHQAEAEGLDDVFLEAGGSGEKRAVACAWG